MNREIPDSDTPRGNQSSNALMRCAITGIPIRDSSDGIWDDGEWISWEWINRQLETDSEEAPVIVDDDLEDEQPFDFALCRMIHEAKDSERRSTETSPLWGRIGELYAAERFGIQLTGNNSQGHDGRLDNDLVEIKTITPKKQKRFVRVKRAGNFSLLVVVNVRQDYQLKARLVRRDRLPKGNGGNWLLLSWARICQLAEPE
ncbi:MAG TPA: hypothetical protein PLU52_00745 [Opitutaceae bacterium]|nr:hypothetical protein [Opitutaceae bacterium]